MGGFCCSAQEPEEPFFKKITALILKNGQNRVIFDIDRKLAHPPVRMILLPNPLLRGTAYVLNAPRS